MYRTNRQSRWAAHLARLHTTDPGRYELGTSWFVDSVLRGCWQPKIARPRGGASGSICPRCDFTGAAKCEHEIWPAGVTEICDEIERCAGYFGSSDPSLLPTAVGCELPVNFSPGGGTDVSHLQGVAWTLADRAASYGARAWLLRPPEWKGRAKKHAHQCTILARLTDEELEIVPRGPRTGRFLSDPVDSVGIGLYLLECAELRTHKYHRPPSAFEHLVDADRPRRSPPGLRGARHR